MDDNISHDKITALFVPWYDNGLLITRLPCVISGLKGNLTAATQFLG